MEVYVRITGTPDDLDGARFNIKRIVADIKRGGDRPFTKLKSSKIPNYIEGEFYQVSLNDGDILGGVKVHYNKAIGTDKHYNLDLPDIKAEGKHGGKNRHTIVGIDIRIESYERWVATYSMQHRVGNIKSLSSDLRASQARERRRFFV